jgi:thymidylate synthase
MSMTADSQSAQLEETREIEYREHHLIHELGRRLACLWQYDRHIANADGRPELQASWRDAKAQEQQHIDQLKQLIQQHVESNCFRSPGQPASPRSAARGGY